MELIEVSSIDFPSLEIYHKFRAGAFREDNSFVADSPKVVNLLLETDLEIKSILATREYYDKYEELICAKSIEKLFVVEKKEMEKIVGHNIHHNCMMHGIRPADTPLEMLDDTILMLDAISSTENIGSIARSAAALGVNSYLIPSNGPHPYGRRALRVSMGYVSRLKVHVYDDIFSTCRALKEKGYKIFAAEITEDSTPLMEVQVPSKWVLLMGHEGRGISKEVLEVCDEVVHIEMQEGIKSFNVGVAASLLMYRFKNSYNCK
ncbi:TrmH family RNA methyltransferase [bacterium]|nr:TrmH family RNA methyltransferase [bacterium]